MTLMQGKPLYDDEAKASALHRFQNNVLGVPWGSLSRGELDFQVFRLLADTGAISLASSDFELSGFLFTSVARVRALRFRYQQRSAPENPQVVQALLVPRNIAFGKAAKDGQIKVSIFDSYLKAYILQQLEAKRALAQVSLTASMVEVDVDALLDVVLDAFEGLPEASEASVASRDDLYRELRRAVKAGKNARALGALSVMPVVVATSAGGLEIIHAVLTSSM